MRHLAEWIGHLIRLELIREGFVVELANHYTTRGYSTASNLTSSNSSHAIALTFVLIPLQKGIHPLSTFSYGLNNHRCSSKSMALVLTHERWYAIKRNQTVSVYVCLFVCRYVSFYVSVYTSVWLRYITGKELRIYERIYFMTCYIFMAFTDIKKTKQIIYLYDKGVIELIFIETSRMFKLYSLLKVVLNGSRTVGTSANIKK